MDDGRDAILYSLRDVDLELELEPWTIPSVLPTEIRSHCCPSYGVAGDHEYVAEKQSGSLVPKVAIGIAVFLGLCWIGNKVDV